MEINRNITMNQVTWFVVMLLGFLIAVFMGSAVGSADFRIVSIVLGAGIGIATFTILGKNYWMLLPLSLSGSNLPALPLAGRNIEFGELAVAGCSLIFIVRLALRRETLKLWRPASLPILFFMSWVIMVFIQNPSGLAFLGSTTGGARFYIKLLLAFFAFVILSTRTYTQRDVRMIFGLLLAGGVLSLINSVLSVILVGPALDPVTGLIRDNSYTWHQELSIPAFALTTLFFARWSPKELFSLKHAWLVLAFVGCIATVLISGKRLMMATIFLPMMVSAILWKQFVAIFIGITIAVALFAALVAGHGTLFELPIVAQRAISWLPGDWAPELQNIAGGADDWRAELRFLAFEQLKRRPIMGTGFSVDISETTTAYLAAERGGDMNIQVAAFALGRAWHNVWYGYAADFGIPLSIAQGVLFLVICIISARVFRAYTNVSLLGTYGMFVFIYTVREIIGSYTGGHSAMDAYQNWWMYGVLISIYYGLPKHTHNEHTNSTDTQTQEGLRTNRHRGLQAAGGH
jgi:hypothetical protein